MILSHFDSFAQNMRYLLEQTLRQYPRPCITDAELETLLGEVSPDSRYGRVKRLLGQHKLIHLRRGLYGLGDELGYPFKPHPFELAAYIYGPSYISLESALAYHQLIPEAVPTITSASSKRSKDFHTPFGTFAYNHLPCEKLYTLVDRVKEGQYTFFMARPWKAIADYVFCYKKDWNGIEPLLKSLRLDYEDLPVLSDEDAALLVEYYQTHRLTKFFQGVQKDLKQK